MDIPIREVVAFNIKKYRKQAGMTQAVLAERIGKTVEMVCQLENNVAGTKLITLEQIARVIGVEPYRFLLRQAYPDYDQISPELTQLIVLLQKQPKEIIDLFLLLAEKIDK